MAQKSSKILPVLFGRHSKSWFMHIYTKSWIWQISGHGILSHWRPVNYGVLWKWPDLPVTFSPLGFQTGILSSSPAVYITWSNYSDLTRPISPKWWFSKGNPLKISRKSWLVKYYNLARYYIASLKLTASFAPWREAESLRENNRIPTIHFQVFWLLVSGRVIIMWFSRLALCCCFFTYFSLVLNLWFSVFFCFWFGFKWFQIFSIFQKSKQLNDQHDQLFIELCCFEEQPSGNSFEYTYIYIYTSIFQRVLFGMVYRHPLSSIRHPWDDLGIYFIPLNPFFLEEKIRAETRAPSTTFAQTDF